MGIQERLNEIYRHLTEQRQVLRRVEKLGKDPDVLDALDGPFLIASNPHYEAARPKIVIVGQENNGWLDHCTYAEFLSGKRSTEEVLEQYRVFDPALTYNTTFFQYFARIRDSILGVDATRYYWAALWLNLFKFNHGGKSTLGSPHEGLIRELQGDVFRQEIEILAPDVVIFLTGPRYDPVIDGFFGSVLRLPLEGHSTWEVAKLQARGLPAMSFRTYHPGYLNRIRRTKPYCLDSILSDIKTCFPDGRSG